MQKLYRVLLAFAMVAASASYAAAGELKLSITNGLVTIVADNVPVSMILAEWARVGQTRILNGEKLLTTVSLQLVDMPERKALDIVLRSASGYMAAEREAASANVSSFDRILILPFSKGPANTMPAAAVPPPFVPRPVPQPEVNDDQMMQPPGNQQAPMQQPGAMMLPGMPQGQNGPQAQPAAPGTNVPTTLPRPGMLPQPPGGAQQPVPFGTPGTPPKPPGGGGGGA
jgi:hypothetical protein